MFLGVATEQYVTAAELLDSIEDFSNVCTYIGRSEWAAGGYVGEFDGWSDCGEVGSDFVVMALEPSGDRDPITVLIQVIMVTTADREALGNILETFRISDFGG